LGSMVEVVKGSGSAWVLCHLPYLFMSLVFRI
jgi:hypothetical protein